MRDKEPGRGKKFCTECRPIAIAETLERTRKALNAYKRAERAARPQVPRQPRGDRGIKKGPFTLDPEGYKTCNGCGRRFTIQRIGIRASGMPHSRCKDCRTEYAYIYQLKTAFGLTADQYLAMFESQGGVCYICRKAPRVRRLAVDHSHSTGQVRGLLCKTCNRDLLGHVRDDVAALRRAIDYLESPPAEVAIGVVFVQPNRPGPKVTEPSDPI